MLLAKIIIFSFGQTMILFGLIIGLVVWQGGRLALKNPDSAFKCCKIFHMFFRK